MSPQVAVLLFLQNSNHIGCSFYFLKRGRNPNWNLQTGHWPPPLLWEGWRQQPGAHQLTTPQGGGGGVGGGVWVEWEGLGVRGWGVGPVKFSHIPTSANSCNIQTRLADGFVKPLLRSYNMKLKISLLSFFYFEAHGFLEVRGNKPIQGGLTFCLGGNKQYKRLLHELIFSFLFCQMNKYISTFSCC